MTETKPIQRVAIIGTGVIGASWASLFFAKGAAGRRHAENAGRGQ